MEEKDVQFCQGGRTSPSLEFSALHLYFSAFLSKVKATDADEGINGRVWYRIVKGKSWCPFVHQGVCPRLAQTRGVKLTILLHFLLEATEPFLTALSKIQL